jgi:hypothetical protein
MMELSTRTAAKRKKEEFRNLATKKLKAVSLLERVYTEAGS